MKFPLHRERIILPPADPAPDRRSNHPDRPQKPPAEATRRSRQPKQPACGSQRHRLRAYSRPYGPPADPAPDRRNNQPKPPAKVVSPPAEATDRSHSQKRTSARRSNQPKPLAKAPVCLQKPPTEAARRSHSQKRPSARRSSRPGKAAAPTPRPLFSNVCGGY